MRRVRIRSVAGFDAPPEGEWVEVIGGMRWTFSHETRMKVESGRLIMRVPTSVQEKLRLREGEDLTVYFTNGSLVARRPSKKTARRRRAA